MKKNTIILILILCILGILFIYKQFSDIELNINGKDLRQSDIEIMNAIYKTLYNVDNVDNSTALFYFLKRYIFFAYSEKFGIEYNKKELKEFENAFNKSILNKIKKISGNKYKSLFLLPEYAYNKLIYLLLTDTLKFQKQRYSEANRILKEWKNDFKNLLSDKYIEYFRKGNIELNNHKYIKSFEDKFLTDDEHYYYVYKINNDYIDGFRIEKSSPDSILLKNKNLIIIDFYNKETLRAIYKLSQHSIWHNIIFNND